MSDAIAAYEQEKRDRLLWVVLMVVRRGLNLAVVAGVVAVLVVLATDWTVFVDDGLGADHVECSAILSDPDFDELEDTQFEYGGRDGVVVDACGRLRDQRLGTVYLMTIGVGLALAGRLGMALRQQRSPR